MIALHIFLSANESLLSTIVPFSFFESILIKILHCYIYYSVLVQRFNFCESILLCESFYVQLNLLFVQYFIFFPQWILIKSTFIQIIFFQLLIQSLFRNNSILFFKTFNLFIFSPFFNHFIVKIDILCVCVYLIDIVLVDLIIVCMKCSRFELTHFEMIDLILLNEIRPIWNGLFSHFPHPIA